MFEEKKRNHTAAGPLAKTTTHPSGAEIPSGHIYIHCTPTAGVVRKPPGRIVEIKVLFREDEGNDKNEFEALDGSENSGRWCCNGRKGTTSRPGRAKDRFGMEAENKRIQEPVLKKSLQELIFYLNTLIKKIWGKLRF